MTRRCVQSLKVENGNEVFVTGDLHLQYEDEDNSVAFAEFLKKAAKPERHLVLLGDVFYYYFENRKRRIGKFAWLMDMLVTAAGRWGSITMMRGNRDFLLGTTPTFPRELAVAEDYLVVDIAGRRTLVSHGDLFLKGGFCYSVFRMFMRSNPARWFARNIHPSAGVKIADGLRWISFRSNNRRGFVAPDYGKIKVQAQKHNASSVVFGHFHRAIMPSGFPYEVPQCWCIAAWERGNGPVLVLERDNGTVIEAKQLIEEKKD